MKVQPRTTRRYPGNSSLIRMLGVILLVWTVSITALFASGGTPIGEAIFLVVAPWAGLAAAVRPDWLLLTLVALPASVTAVIPTGRIVPLILVALLGVLLNRRSLSLGFGTGLPALLCIAVAGYLFQADVVSYDANKTQQLMMMLIIYYVLLAVLAFNLVISGELRPERLAAAFVVCVVGTLVAALAGYESYWFPGGSAILSRTYLGYLAAGGFGVTLATQLAKDHQTHSLREVLLTVLLLGLVIASFGRAVWIAAAATSVLLVLLDKKRVCAVAIVTLLVAVSLWIPTARQEIASSETGDIAAALRTGQIATGRWELWTELWVRAEQAFPWGNGFGFTWSLSSEELFGAQGLFGGPDAGVIFPHSDFVFLLVEFGIVGLLLMLMFWAGLLRANFRAASSLHPEVRVVGRSLIGIVMTGLLVALVDNLFAIRPFAERFFPIAGMVFALGLIERTTRSNPHPARTRG